MVWLYRSINVCLIFGVAVMVFGLDKSPRPIYQHITPAPEHISATVTAYTARACETNEDPGHTATMETPVAGRTCAVSRDLLHWLGGRIYIEGVGVRDVNDLMNKRFDRRVDVCIGTIDAARAFGKQARRVVFLGRYK